MHGTSTPGTRGFPVADTIRSTPDDSESSVVPDESESEVPVPATGVTDDQNKDQGEVVRVTAANPTTTSEQVLGMESSHVASLVEPTARTASQRSMLTMLADVPVADSMTDHLDYLAYADALCGLIDNPRTPTPLTIAVSAAWGAGKTSLVNLVTGRLAERTRWRGGRQQIVCVFPAWLHDDAPHLGAALAAKVARDANRYRAWPRRLVSPLPSAMLTPEQRWRRRIMIGSASLIVAVLALLPASVRTSIKTSASVDAAIRAVVGQRWAPLALLMLAVLVIWRKVFASAQAAARFVDDPKSEAATGSMWQVREQLGRLIREAIRNPGRFGEWLRRNRPKIAARIPRYRQERRRVVLIIDDLERCRPPRAIDVCEVASQLLGHQDVVTIIIADMTTLAASAEIRYAALETIPTSQGDAADRLYAIQPKGAYGRLYLEKLVQIQFDLPPPSPMGLRSMLAGSVGGEELRSVRPSAKRSPSSWGLPELAKLVGKRGALAALSMIGIVAAIAGFLAGPMGAVVAGAATVGVLLAAALYANLWLRRLTDEGFLLGLLVQSLKPPRILGLLDAVPAFVSPALMTIATPLVQAVTASIFEVMSARLRKDREERFMTDESPERRQGEAAILRFLAHDDVPRRAKRMVNHLRLLLLVADKRDMFGGSPPLEAVHLGKWVVLLERWPELGRALRADPSVMTLIEEAASTDSRVLEDVLDRIVPAVASSADLVAFLKDETKLAGLVERLIYYLPALPRNEVDSSA
jgi:hypothetical protein